MSEKNGQSAGRLSRRTALQKGGLVLGSSLIGLSSVIGTAVAEPTEIDECTEISDEEYVLTDDLSAEGDCLKLGPNVTLDGNGHTVSGDGTGTGIFVDPRGGVQIRNLTIENFETGISISDMGGGEITLENTVVSDNAFTGIRGGRKTGIAVRNSTISNNGRGMFPGEACDVSITQSTLSGNNLEAVGTSIGHFIDIDNSTVRGNGAGIATGEGTFVDNIISNNDGFGIRLIGLVAPMDLGTACIVGNDILKNDGAGIDFTFSSGDVRENTIRNNQTGIVLADVKRDTPSYEFRKNNIEGNNEFGILHQGDGPTAVATCNYWGHATGPVHKDNPRKNSKGDKVSGNVEFRPWSVREIRDGEANCIGGSKKSKRGRGRR